MSRYNVMVPKDKTDTFEKMKKEFISLRVVDRFASNDWNVELPDDGAYEDRFSDWCEDNGVTCEMV